MVATSLTEYTLALFCVCQSIEELSSEAQKLYMQALHVGQQQQQQQEQQQEQQQLQGQQQVGDVPSTSGRSEQQAGQQQRRLEVSAHIVCHQSCVYERCHVCYYSLEMIDCMVANILLSKPVPWQLAHENISSCFQLYQQLKNLFPCLQLVSGGRVDASLMAAFTALYSSNNEQDGAAKALVPIATRCRQLLDSCTPLLADLAMLVLDAAARGDVEQEGYFSALLGYHAQVGVWPLMYMCLNLHLCPAC